MNEHVWLITDKTTGEATYIRHGKDGNEARWRTIGPFAYSDPDEAMRSADNPNFFPEGVEDGDFGVLEVPAADFVKAVFNGFPPSMTDVFALDGGLLPLSEEGAAWVDEGLEASVWTPLFDQNGEDGGLLWLDKVLKQVSERLSMGVDIIEAIGTLNAVAEDIGDEVSQANQLIQEHVRIAIIPEPGTIGLKQGERFHELSPESRFWLHTKGLVSLGRPELEIRNVPVWWVTAAGAELHGWAAYSLKNQIKPGIPLLGGGPVPIELSAEQSPDPFWEKSSCLRLTVSRVMFKQDTGVHPESDEPLPTRH